MKYLIKTVHHNGAVHGSFVLGNVFSIKYLGDETHYFVAGALGQNIVTVVNAEGYLVREYNTQSYNAI